MACKEKQYAQALLDIDAVARCRGDRFGICDCIDNKGNPYPSQRLHNLMDEASKEMELVSTKEGKFINEHFSTAKQWE